MGFLNSISGKAKVKSANKKVLEARKSKDPEKTEQLLSEAMLAYAEVSSDSSAFKDALYNWGMALLYTARLKIEDEAKALYEEAGKKFSYCLVTKEDYMAAGLDWGVSLMELAPLQEESERAATYVLAKEKFAIADSIQKGVASYNFACLHAVAGDFDACKAALELAHEYKNLPDDEDILNDADMQIAKTQPWFDEFLAFVHAPEPEEEQDDTKDDEAASTGAEYSKTKLKNNGYKVEYDKKDK